MRRSCLAVLAWLFWATVFPTGAGAHPHIWISAEASFVFKDENVVAIRQTWIFDEFFSAALIKDFDVNRDGRFDEAETEQLRQNAFSALKDFTYFTHVRVDGKDAKITEVSGFSAEIDGGKIVYRFTAHLPEPVDPRTQKASFGLYDHSYYVDVALKDDGFKAVNAGRCAPRLFEDKENPIYFGMVIPQRIAFDCATR